MSEDYVDPHESLHYQAHEHQCWLDEKGIDCERVEPVLRVEKRVNDVTQPCSICTGEPTEKEKRTIYFHKEKDRPVPDVKAGEGVTFQVFLNNKPHYLGIHTAHAECYKPFEEYYKNLGGEILTIKKGENCE